MSGRPDGSSEPEFRPDDSASPDDAQWEQAERGLVRLAQAGDREAFMVLIQKYQRRCAAIALRLLDNPHDTADLLQDCFLRAFEQIAALKDGARFGSWLMRIVTNRGLNFRRSRTRRKTVSIDTPGHAGSESEDSLRDIIAAGVAPDFATHSREFRTAINRAMQRLPKKQRTALVLFTLQEMPQKQIAEVLGCSIEAVKWYVFSARRTLRRELASFLED